MMNNRSRKGTTLAETLIYAVVLGIVIIIAYNMFTQYQKHYKRGIKKADALSSMSNFLYVIRDDFFHVVQKNDSLIWKENLKIVNGKLIMDRYWKGVQTKTVQWYKDGDHLVRTIDGKSRFFIEKILEQFDISIHEEVNATNSIIVWMDCKIKYRNSQLKKSITYSTKLFPIFLNKQINQ